MPNGQALTEAEIMLMIAELRCGLSMYEVADHLGVNERTVLRYVQGKRDHMLTPDQKELLQTFRKPSRNRR